MYVIWSSVTELTPTVNTSVQFNRRGGRCRAFCSHDFNCFQHSKYLFFAPCCIVCNSTHFSLYFCS